jgi:glyoxalase superfamily protein
MQLERGLADRGLATRTSERHWTPVPLDFDVDGVDAAVAEVERLGGTVEGVERGEWGAAAFCADPSAMGSACWRFAPEGRCCLQSC